MASYTDTAERRCAFQQKRPDRFSIFDNGCQFTSDVDNQLPDCSQQLIDHGDELWCPFHLPKDYWISQENERFISGRQISKTIVDLAKSFDSEKPYYALDLTGVVFPAGIRFENINFPSVIFKGCEFLDHVSFKDCNFQFYTHFDDAKFYKNVTIFDCCFSNELVFSEACFFDSLRMTGSECKDIRAHNSKFFEWALFSNFLIKEKIDLSHSEFSQELQFSDIDSVNEISLINAQIRQGFSIRNCHPAQINLTMANVLGPMTVHPRGSPVLVFVTQHSVTQRMQFVARRPSKIGGVESLIGLAIPKCPSTNLARLCFLTMLRSAGMRIFQLCTPPARNRKQHFPRCSSIMLSSWALFLLTIERLEIP